MLVAIGLAFTFAGGLIEKSPGYAEYRNAAAGSYPSWSRSANPKHETHDRDGSHAPATERYARIEFQPMLTLSFHSGWSKSRRSGPPARTDLRLVMK